MISQTKLRSLTRSRRPVNSCRHQNCNTWINWYRIPLPLNKRICCFLPNHSLGYGELMRYAKPSLRPQSHKQLDATTQRESLEDLYSLHNIHVPYIEYRLTIFCVELRLPR